MSCAACLLGLWLNITLRSPRLRSEEGPDLVQETPERVVLTCGYLARHSTERNGPGRRGRMLFHRSLPAIARFTNVLGAGGVRSLSPRLFPTSTSGLRRPLRHWERPSLGGRALRPTRPPSQWPRSSPVTDRAALVSDQCVALRQQAAMRRRGLRIGWPPKVKNVCKSTAGRDLRCSRRD